MHQKCHINSQLPRKSLFFLFNYKYWKTMYRKKGRCDEIVPRKKTQSHMKRSTKFIRCPQIKTITQVYGVFVHQTPNWTPTEGKNKTKKTFFPHSCTGVFQFLFKSSWHRKEALWLQKDAVVVYLSLLHPPTHPTPPHPTWLAFHRPNIWKQSLMWSINMIRVMGDG